MGEICHECEEWACEDCDENDVPLCRFCCMNTSCPENFGYDEEEDGNAKP